MIRATVLSLLLYFFNLTSPSASVSKQSDDNFKPFWDKFKTAVIKGDKETVASLSKFPLGMSFGIRTIKSKAELLRRYREVFNQQTDAAKCFVTKEPEKDETNPGLFTIACPDQAGNDVVVYEFKNSSVGWRFVRLDNLNE